LGVFLRDDPSSYSKLNNILLVMAGGRGARLMPLTSNCPKPMLLLGDKPILEHTINKAKMMGFSEIVISINYLGTIIQDYFNDGSEFGVKITYLEEGEPLGTGGALRLLQGDLREPIIVINGDVVTEIDYIKILEFHETQKAHATMAVRLHEWQHPFGVVNVQQSRVVGFEEKPINQTYINSGTYVIGDKMRKLIKDGEKIDMPDLLMRGSEAGLTVLAYVFDDAWIDIGRVEEYEKANKIFAKKIPLEF